jgi:hypothetical protein
MSNEMDAEMKELAKDMKDANDETKASIQKQIDKLKEKSNALNESISKKRAHNKSTMKFKIAMLKGQYEKADEKRKARLKKSMKKLKADNNKNKSKLKKASKKLSKLVL